MYNLSSDIYFYYGHEMYHEAIPPLKEEIEGGRFDLVPLLYECFIQENQYEEAFYLSKEYEYYYGLAECYRYGYGVEERPKKAFAIYYKGSQNGDLNCYYEYAMAKLYGIGCTRNTDVGLLELKRVAEKDIEHKACKDAVFQLGQYYFMNKDYEKAYRYLSHLSKEEYPEALNFIGVMYSTGLYVNEDKDIAFYYYKEAVEYGSINAIPNLFFCYFSAEGTIPSLERCYELLDMAEEIVLPDEILTKMWKAIGD